MYKFGLYKFVKLENRSCSIAVISFQNVQTFHGASLALSKLGSKRGKPTERLGHKATGLKPEKSGHGSRVANRAQYLPVAVTSCNQWRVHDFHFRSQPHFLFTLRLDDDHLAERSD